MRAIASSSLLFVLLACGGPEPEPTPASPPALPAPWLGEWRLAYGVDLAEAVELPDATLEAHPFRRIWPPELAWLQPVAEPVLEAWLWTQLSSELADFFVEVEALPRRLEDVELGTVLTLDADGRVFETWQSLGLPEACGGSGLEVELDGLRTSDGAWRLASGRLQVERRLRFRSEAASRALLEGLALCVGGSPLEQLLDQGLDCELEGLGELSELGGILCAGLREAWQAKYRPRGAVHEWTLHQGLEPGALRGGGSEVLVTGTEGEPRAEIMSWRVR